MSAPKKVLLVEDEFILYDELVDFFEDKGFKVIGSNGQHKPLSTYEDALKALNEEEPDIAVLDIKIKGNKDGLELGTYIKNHFNIPIVFLSAYDNYDNLERAKNIAADGFVVKLDKPVNKKQLWADVVRLMPKMETNIKRRQEGRFMKVKEIDTLLLERKIKSPHQQPSDPVELKTFIKWDDIKMIASANKIWKNYILLHGKGDSKSYSYRGTLDEIYSLLPDYFIRFNNSEIINAYCITAEGKQSETYYIGEIKVEISETYQAEAFAKLKLYLSSKF